MARKKEGNESLKVYWRSKMYQEKPHEIILCREHREKFYSSYPNACGYGEFYPPEKCKMCKEEKAGIR